MKSFPLLATVTAGIIGFSSINLSIAHDKEQVFTSADLCAPVNVGKANRNIQNIRGTTQNLSDSESIAVSCPLTNVNSNTVFGVLVIAENTATVAQEFKCVLREKDPGNLDIQTIIQNGEIEASGFGVFTFDDVAVIDPQANRFNLTCLLPPLSNLGMLSTGSF